MVSKNKILIVDDDSNIAELISLYLAKECFDTQIVGDGESALRAVRSYQPDLILLDLMLPGIDGYQVCREVRASSNVPIIMLSAKGEVFDKVLGLELGADDYMEKPFDSKELVARVKAVLRRYKTAARADISTCRQRNWSCFIFSPLLPDVCLPASSSWIRSGAMSMSVTHVLSMSISKGSVKRPAPAPAGRLQPSGGSVINSN